MFTSSPCEPAICFKSSKKKCNKKERLCLVLKGNRPLPVFIPFLDELKHSLSLVKKFPCQIFKKSNFASIPLNKPVSHISKTRQIVQKVKKPKRCSYPTTKIAPNCLQAVLRSYRGTFFIFLLPESNLAVFRAFSTIYMCLHRLLATLQFASNRPKKMQ